MARESDRTPVPAPPGTGHGIGKSSPERHPELRPELRPEFRPFPGHAHDRGHAHDHAHAHAHHHSTSEVWRRFEEHPLTHSMAHYLMAIAELREEHGYARITDVARRLGVTKGSASIALRAMRDKGYVAEDENRMLLLTPSGRSAVASITGSRAEFLRFFHEVLGVEEDAALEDACKLEHLVSPLTTERLRAFLDWIHSPCDGATCGGRALLAKFRGDPAPAATEAPPPRKRAPRKPR